MTTSAQQGAAVPDGPLDLEALRRIDAYWRAANYLPVGQIYLLDNPRIAVLRIPAREDLWIARRVADLQLSN